MIDALERALASFDIPRSIVAEALESARACVPVWQRRDADALVVAAKVMQAFASAGVTDAHLQGTVGYGYHDFGREAFERIFASAMDASSALVRVQLVSGTQAIVASLAALGGTDGTILSMTGRPYDTLRLALVDHPRSLRPYGVAYEELTWAPGAALDEAAVTAAARRQPAVIFIQRSRGYASRSSASVADIRRLVTIAKRECASAPVVVDNCYGELVEPLEPCAVGADVVVGSLIKNPGGGMAVTGAYIAGASEAVERIAERIFAPGLGSRVGPNLDAMRGMYAGLYRAPKAVAESLKIMDFAAALFQRLGYTVDPLPGAPRTDIIQAIALGTRAKLQAFAAGLQRMLPVNARAVPEPGPVPGYADPVIMAGGSFVTGSTMELSCDAPLREPYEVYLQGGMDTAYGMIAVASAAAAAGPA